MSSVETEKTVDAPVTLDANGEVSVAENKDINPQSTEWNTTSDVNPDAVSETGMVEEAKESLEAYLSILKEAGQDGISRQTQAVMNVHLRQIDRTIGYSKVTPALECVDASPRTALYKSTISLEDIGDRIGAAGDKLVEMFKKLLAWLGEQIRGARAKYDKLKSYIGSLKKTVEAAPEEDGEEMTISSPALFTDGKLELGFFKDAAFCKWFTRSYTPWLLSGIAMVPQKGNDPEALESAYEDWLSKAPKAGLKIAGDITVDYAENSSELLLIDSDTPHEAKHRARSRSELLRTLQEDEAFSGELGGLLTAIDDVLAKSQEAFDKVMQLGEHTDSAMGMLKKVSVQKQANIGHHLLMTAVTKSKQIETEAKSRGTSSDELNSHMS